MLAMMIGKVLILWWIICVFVIIFFIYQNNSFSKTVELCPLGMFGLTWGASPTEVESHVGKYATLVRDKSNFCRMLYLSDDFYYTSWYAQNLAYSFNFPIEGLASVCIVGKDEYGEAFDSMSQQITSRHGKPSDITGQDAMWVTANAIIFAKRDSSCMFYLYYSSSMNQLAVLNTLSEPRMLKEEVEELVPGYFDRNRFENFKPL